VFNRFFFAPQKITAAMIAAIDTADRIAVGKVASRHANVMTFPIRVVDNISVEGRRGLARAAAR